MLNKSMKELGLFGLGLFSLVVVLLLSSSASVNAEYVTVFFDGAEDNTLDEWGGGPDVPVRTDDRAKGGSWSFSFSEDYDVCGTDENFDRGYRFVSYQFLDCNDSFSILFGFQDSNNYYYAKNSPHLEEWFLGKTEGGSDTTLDSYYHGNNCEGAGEWVKTVVNWDNDGDISVSWYDNTGSKFTTLSASDSTFESGSIGFTGPTTTTIDNLEVEENREVTASADNVGGVVVTDSEFSENVGTYRSFDWSWWLTENFGDNYESDFTVEVRDNYGTVVHSETQNLSFDPNETKRLDGSVRFSESESYTIYLLDNAENVLDSHSFTISKEVLNISDFPDEVANRLNLSVVASELLLCALVLIPLNLVLVKVGGGVSQFSVVAGFVNFPVIGLLIHIEWMPLWIPIMITFMLLLYLGQRFSGIGGSES